MESIQEVKKLISDAKNICIIPSDNYEGESIPNALALFYTLKELNKNVNLIVQGFPEKFNFLIPSLDFISSPKNFVISIPKEVADVSQIYYEKNDTHLKIHLAIERGNIKKDAVSFYFSEAKPDLVITLGIKDFQSYLQNQLDFFGFILNAPIVNIDNQEPAHNILQGDAVSNKKFGAVNVVKDGSLSEATLDIVKSIDENLLSKNTATCLLAGLMLYYDHFKSPKTDHKTFEIVAELIKKGASRQHIIDSLHKKLTKEQVAFLSEIFQNLKTAENNNISFALLNSGDFQNLTDFQVSAAIEKINAIGFQNDLLVLWKSHASEPTIKGFFYSKNQDLIHRIMKNQHAIVKNGWISIIVPGSDIDAAKEQIFSLLNGRI